MRVSSSSKRFKVFDFTGDDERIEKTSKKFLKRFAKPNSDDPAKYTFLQRFATGIKTRKRDIRDGPFNADARDGSFKENISSMDANALSGSSNNRPTINSCPKYDNAGCFSSGLHSSATRALNSTGQKYLDSTPPHFRSENDAIGENLGDDSAELSLSTASCNPTENEGILEVKFAVLDPHWSEKKEAINSGNVRYKAGWNVLSDSDECFKEVTYPKRAHDAIRISKRDMELLQPEKFINDSIVDFYIKYLENNIIPDKEIRFHLFNTFFFRKLADPDKDPARGCEGKAAFQRVCRWTRNINLFEKDYIFIPVNFKFHWSLIVICHPGEVANFKDEKMEKSAMVPCILHMNSIKRSHRGLKKLFQSYLWEEWKERHRELPEDFSSKFLNLQFVPLELPQQQNSFDCGLFLLHYLELFLKQAPVNFSPFKIKTFSNFLGKDWFPPSEASLKRAHIKKVIYAIAEDNLQEGSPATTCNDKYHSSALSETNEIDSGIEFLHETFNSSETCLGSYSSSSTDRNIETTPLSALRQRGVNCFGESPGQSKNVMSPIEEGQETGEHTAYSSMSSEELVDLIVEDSEESNETPDIDKSENSALKTKDKSPVSVSKKRAGKRPRQIMPSRFTRSCLKDLR